MATIMVKTITTTATITIIERAGILPRSDAAGRPVRCVSTSDGF
jgi:hypothetical protein